MSKHTDKSLFIISSLPRLYQALLSGIEDYKKSGNHIINDVKIAQSFRQVEKVVNLSQILVNNPIKEYQLIGQYYLAWSKYRSDKNQPHMLDSIIEQSETYKTKALTFRGALSFYQGKLDEAMFFYTESLKTASLMSDHIEAARCVATVKAIEGFHNSALKDLERPIPFLRYAEPKMYYDFLNSLAVELGEVGRKYEARNIIQSVLASPFAIAYPEWRETAEELKGSNRSFAVLNPTRQRSGKILSMPVIEHAESVEQHKPAPVISLETWKARMVKNREGLDSRQLLLRLMELGTAPGMTDGKLLQVIQLMERLLTEPQKPDDESVE